jgi:hypothetical protein
MMFGKVQSVYWWRRVENFGDVLSPLLLARFSDLNKIVWKPIAEADIVSVGSILEHIPPGWRGFIVGSGLLRETSKLKFNPRDAHVLALRGPLTARAFTGQFALGDPALLANELVEPQKKTWDLGILPHWQDSTLADRFQKLVPSQFTRKVISPLDDPLTVIREISACRRIVTSSLHGMVVADAIGGIPRRVESCDALAKDGGLFKYQDYSASIKTPFEIGKMIEPKRNRVDDAKFEVFDAFRELSRVYGKT